MATVSIARQDTLLEVQEAVNSGSTSYPNVSSGTLTGQQNYPGTKSITGKGKVTVMNTSTGVLNSSTLSLTIDGCEFALPLTHIVLNSSDNGSCSIPFTITFENSCTVSISTTGKTTASCLYVFQLAD